MDPEVSLGMPAVGGRDSAIPMVTATAFPVNDDSKGHVDSYVPDGPVNLDYNDSASMNREQMAALIEQGFPIGLAQELGNSRAAYPLRFWIVDNSGSMRNTDGHALRGESDHIRVICCNRWTELQGACEYHVELAGLLEATTIFRMLNDPGTPIGPQEFSVAETNSPNSVSQDVATAKNIIRLSSPKGVTPLTDHLREIRRRIQAVEHELRSRGQQAVLVIATDGLPSNNRGESPPEVQKEFVDSLRALQDLPIWVVVRLCTDDDEVVDYYNDLDQILELPLEVIDDFFGEGKEIHAANKWLNYALPLHRCREMGYHHRIFDLLDERLLNKDELREFLQLLFGSEVLMEAPDVHTDWKGFLEVLSRVNQGQGKQWNPNTKKMSYWVDMKEIQKVYRDRRFSLFRRKK